MPKLTLPDAQPRPLELYYELDGHGEPVLLLHGLGSSTLDWSHQRQFLAKRYQVLTLDLRGHGRSDIPPGEFSIPGFAADVAAVLDKLHLAPAHVVGISMGAAVGYQLALDRPDRVNSLTAINCPPEFVARTWKERLMLWQRLLLIRVLDMRRIGRVLAARLFSGEDLASERATFEQRWAKNDKDAYLRSLRALLGWTVVDRLAELRCRVLLLVSELDYTPVERKERFLPKLPDARLRVVPGARHAVTMERPEEVNALLGDFFAGKW